MKILNFFKLIQIFDSVYKLDGLFFSVMINDIALGIYFLRKYASVINLKKRILVIDRRYIEISYLNCDQMAFVRKNNMKI